jgi:hypothetical protein
LVGAVGRLRLHLDRAPGVIDIVLSELASGGAEARRGLADLLAVAVHEGSGAMLAVLAGDDVADVRSRAVIALSRRLASNRGGAIESSLVPQLAATDGTLAPNAVLTGLIMERELGDAAAVAEALTHHASAAIRIRADALLARHGR